MRILSKYAVIIIFMAIQMLLAFPSNKAFACSCAGVSVAERLNRSNAVFTGEVIGIGRSVNGEIGKLREYTFQVRKSWKGATDKQITIYSYDGSEASCGYSFDKRQTYLVYAYTGKNGLLETNLCSGNLKDADAKADYALLGAAPHVFGEDVSARQEEMSYGDGWLPEVIWYIVGFIVLLGIVILVIFVRRKRE
ncbi:hypothetical protein ACFQZT_10335 [Paenibacillus sp. GCM10027628]|uniref:hypothetical protein n=1 Tax=Paenibacillus sp. GCM10027628 TaxID=3273413 RepID=UPI003643715F